MKKKNFIIFLLGMASFFLVIAIVNTIDISLSEKFTEINTSEYEATVQNVEEDSEQCITIYTEEFGDIVKIINKNKVVDVKQLSEMSGEKIYFRIENAWNEKFNEKDMDFIYIVSLRTETEEVFSLDDYNQSIATHTLHGIGKVIVVTLLFLMLAIYLLLEEYLWNKNRWNEINNETDLSNFMEKICHFHDSDIKDLKYVSGTNAGDKLNIPPINSRRTLNIMVQCHSQGISIIEMEFSGLKSFELFLQNEEYTSKILDSTIILKEEGIYWCACGNVAEKEMNTYEETLVCAEKLRWRVIYKRKEKGKLFVSCK